MKRTICAWAISMFVVPWVSAVTPIEIATYLDVQVPIELERWEIPGAAVAVVYDGEVIVSKGYGVRNINGPKPVDEHTLFAIASNSKTFTCAAIAMLVDEGRLDWDDKVIEYLPNFTLAESKRAKALTIRDLLSHQTGVEGANRLWWFSQFSREELLERMRYLESKEPHRASYKYNNLMYLVAGLVLEQVSGMTWDEFMQTRIFVPLGMNHSTTSISAFDSNDNVAMPHAYNREGEMAVTEYYSSDHVAPAASINSCAADMAKWMQFLLNDGKWNGQQLLSEKQINEMRTIQVESSMSSFERLGRSVQNSAYGLGHRMYEYEGHRFVEHGGHLVTFRSKVCLIPEKKFGVTVLTPTYTEFSTGLAYEVADMALDVENKNWVDVYYQETQNDLKKFESDKKEIYAKRQENSKPSLPLNAYAGVYENHLYGKFIVKYEDGGLHYNHNNTPWFKGKLPHWFDDTFMMVPHLLFRDEELVEFEFSGNKVKSLKFEGYRYKRNE